ncbi:MAG: phospholipase D-like domain-containing protein, partial [Dongiaceae bacterium]
DLKTHAKIALVTRREGDGLRSYVHFGTGNYNSITSRVYTDLSLFSADPALCNDATKLFNFMTGYAKPEKMEKLIIAPLAMRKSLLELIAKEIAHVKAGKPGAIWAKMNSLVDAEIIRALYEASSAGVNINLIVRGICCLRPGVKGLSENIKVKSIVGRFLEHSRIVCFGDGHGLPAGEAKVFISSADWMPRNLNGRLEVMVPVENPTVHQQVLQEIMTHCLEDAAQSWELTNDGTYQRLSGGFSAQDYFLAHQSLSGRGSLAARSKKKAHRAKPGG